MPRLELVKALCLSDQEREGVFHKGQVFALSWNPKPCNDSEHMLASAGDDTMIIWSCHNSSYSSWTAEDLKAKEHMRTCAWHPSGLIIAGAGWESVMLWQYDNEKKSFSCIKQIEHTKGSGETVSLSWNANGKLLLVCNSFGQIGLIEEDGGDYRVRCRLSLNKLGPVSSAQWAHKENKFAVACFNCIMMYEMTNDCNEPNMVESINNKGNKDLPRDEGYHAQGVSGITFGSLDETLISVGCLTSLKEHNDVISCVDWSRCGDKLIASACYGRNICLYMAGYKEVPKDKIRSYKCVSKKTKAHRAAIHDIKWSPKDPHMFASAGGDKVVNMWTVVN